MSPFCEATDTPASALFELGRGIHVTHFLRFTSGATPANLLVASMAAEPSLPHTSEALAGLETRSYHTVVHSVRSGRPDALPTELSWQGFLLLFECIRQKYIEDYLPAFTSH